METTFKKVGNKLEITRQPDSTVDSKTYEELEEELNQAIESLVAVKAQHAAIEAPIQETINDKQKCFDEAVRLEVKAEIIGEEINAV